MTARGNKQYRYQRTSDIFTSESDIDCDISRADGGNGVVLDRQSVVVGAMTNRNDPEPHSPFGNFNRNQTPERKNTNKFGFAPQVINTPT